MTANILDLRSQTGLTAEELRNTPLEVKDLNKLVPAEYDEIVLEYDLDTDINKVVFKQSSSIISTLTIGYNVVNGEKVITNVLRG